MDALKSLLESVSLLQPYPLWVKVLVTFWVIYLAVLFLILISVRRSEAKLSVTDQANSKLQHDSIRTERQNILSFRYIAKHYQTKDSIEYLKLKDLSLYKYPTWDSAIELINNLFLKGDANKLQNRGWLPSKIRIIPTNKEFEYDPRIIDESVVVDERNWEKYCLSKFRPPDLTDARETWLKLWVDETRFHTVKKALPTATSNKSLRHELTDVNLQSHKIPHSLCLHFIIRFKDKSLLCMKRSSKPGFLLYEPGKWSISAEEQLRKEDFGGSRGVVVEWFDRAIFEEAFPLREEEIRKRWEDEIRSTFEFRRIWSVIAEEKYGAFSLVGIVQLNIDSLDYVHLFNKIVRNESLAKADPEGDLFVMRQEDLLTLAERGSCDVYSISDPKFFQTVREQDLHSTSWYRIVCLLTALGGSGRYATS